MKIFLHNFHFSFAERYKKWYVYKTISLKAEKKKEKRGEAWLLCRLLWSWGQMNRREGRTHPLAMKQFIHYNHFPAACQIISASRHNAHSASPPEKSRPLPHSLFTWATSPPYWETLRSTKVWAHSRALHSVCLRPSRGPRKISFRGGERKKIQLKIILGLLETTNLPPSSQLSWRKKRARTRRTHSPHRQYPTPQEDMGDKNAGKKLPRASLWIIY